MTKLPVLIVDDDRNLLEALCATLRLAGHTTLAAGDGDAALALLQTQQVGLVVSDVQMKPMDGLQLLQKNQSSQPRAPGVADDCLRRDRESGGGDARRRLRLPVETVRTCSPVGSGGALFASRRRAWCRRCHRQRPAHHRTVGAGPARRAVLRHGDVDGGKRLRQGGAGALSSTNIPGAPGSRLSRSIAPQFRRTCWRPRCSATRKARLPAPSSRNRGNSSRRRAARCCWMRFRKCRWRCRPSCCGCCRKGRSSGSGGARRLRSISGCLPLPTATCRPWLPAADSARICITG